MAVTNDDVLHVAQLARLAVDAARLPSLVSELNGILAHMEELGAVEIAPAMGDGRSETPTALRSDELSPLPLATRREFFAPQMRDGFFLVPRLATHEDQGSRSP